MQMIIAVDLLPKVESLYKVNQLIPYGQMDIQDMQVRIASDVIHGTQTIRTLQGDVVFTGILGGFIGKYIKHHMDIKKIRSDIIWVEMDTPHEIKIADEDIEKVTTLSQNLSLMEPKIVTKLEQKIKLSIKPTTTLLLEGRLLNGACPSIYSRLIEQGKTYSAKTIITTDQQGVLEAILEQAPFGLMFTITQLEKLGIDTSQVEGMVSQLRAYIDRGVRYIGVDLENQGGLLLSKNKSCYVEPIVDQTKRWIRESSAAFLGAFTIGIDRKYEQEKIAKLCVAAALAFQQTQESGNYNKNAIDQLFNKVKVRELFINLAKER